jgi:hypothetical protein
MLKTVRSLIKGITPADAGVDVVTTWEEFEPDDYDGRLDGDDRVHHGSHAHMLDLSKLAAHRAETDDGK